MKRRRIDEFFKPKTCGDSASASTSSVNSTSAGVCESEHLQSTNHNQVSVNKADGVIMYINEKIKHQIQIEIYGSLSIISALKNTCSQGDIKISGVYRCHDIAKKEFVVVFLLGYFIK